jgi:hypothetical protein
MSDARAVGSTDLEHLRSFAIPRELIDETLAVLATAGRSGNEAFAVWGATVENETVVFRSMIVPDQEAHNTSKGLLVTVSGQALFEVNRELFQRGEVLAGQVHSHPTDAYHSDTDDCFSLVTLRGALSVVVPDFARGGYDDVGNWAWYRLTGTGEWAGLTKADKVRVVYRDGA